ncbi:hypothetical protein HDV05_002694 [Chytridiales sp. JEL 0842]|nr:hypothetical protein HDV05_002694 [Chytridiales sp. JEL 0842]
MAAAAASSSSNDKTGATALNPTTNTGVVPPNPTTTAASSSTRQTTHQRIFHGIHTIHHSQFSKQEPKDTNLPLHVRQHIIDSSPARWNGGFVGGEAKKVTVRTEQRFEMRDGKGVEAERLRRRADVYKCGFCSDAKEPYKPLGDPVLDTDALLFGCLKVGPDAFQRGNNTKTAEITTNVNEVKSATRARTIATKPRQSNGFSIIKEHLAKSRQRLNGVKFGIPFVDICEEEIQARAQENAKPAVSSSTSEGVIDWSTWKIDVDKQIYYQHVAEKNKVVQGGNHDRIPNKTTDSGTSLGSKESIDGKAETPKENVKMSAKQMEVALGVTKHDSIHETTDKFFQARELYYDQKQRLNQILSEDLTRMDHERKNEFIRKFKAFQVGKNAVFVDDIAVMRQRAAMQRKAEKVKAVRMHRWYNELCAKVNATNGARSMQVSEFEELLLSRIRCNIEDNLPFTQQTLVQLMKLIPASEFMKDDIQRIIRFVKQHENFSEREYLDAVDMASHGISFERL